MPFLVKDIIFDLFGHHDKSVDTNKDAQGKGTLERFNELIGDDIDVNILPNAINVIDNTLVPKTALDKFIPYLEFVLGQPVNIGADLPTRRKILGFILRFYQIKGTTKSYSLLLGMLGFAVVITEHFSKFGFDSPTTFDSDERTFDSACPTCSDYSVALTSGQTITPELLDAIFNVLEFNEPINAKLREITHNGTFLVQEIISIFVDGNGDLIYNNQFDPTLILTIDQNGDLIISGDNASKYSINDDGDLIYTI